jgi:hypothetical protein
MKAVMAVHLLPQALLMLSLKGGGQTCRHKVPLMPCFVLLQVGTIRLAGRTTSSFSRGKPAMCRLQPVLHVLDLWCVFAQPGHVHCLHSFV